MLGEVIDRLIEANITLWHKEDQRRDRGLSDTDRLRAADDVIVWNRKRNQAIDDINALLAAQVSGESGPSQGLPEAASMTTLLTGSLGDLTDRLAIARIRHYHLTESRDTQNTARLTQVLNEIKDLKDQIDQAFAIAPNLPPGERQRLLGFGKNRTYKDEESYGPSSS
jgi:hypothetical protein